MSIFVLGIDLGKNVCSLVGLDEAGAVVVRRRLRRDSVVEFVGRLPACIVAMEACCGAHHLGRVLGRGPHDLIDVARICSPLCEGEQERRPGRRGDRGSGDAADDALCAGQCDMAIYDQYLEPDYEKGIADDMINVLDHFEQESLDFITTRHTLEHAISPMFQLWAYNRILKMGGKLFVIVPNHSREWVWFPTHHNCLPYDNWVMLFHRMGFNIKTADAGSWKRADSEFIEWRFELIKASKTLRF